MYTARKDWQTCLDTHQLDYCFVYYSIVVALFLLAFPRIGALLLYVVYSIR